jgi:hypothetical protein
MSLVTFTIPNLTNGVSQQPVSVRLPNQSQSQINTTSRVTDGLSKRNPINLINIEKLKDPILNTPITLLENNIVFHSIKGVDSEGVPTTAQLMVRCNTGEVWVGYVEGKRLKETYEVGTFPYLITNNRQDIKFLTNGDDTYILNKSVIVENSGINEDQLTMVQQQGSLVYIQQGFFGTEYKINLKFYLTDGITPLENVTATYSTPSSTSTNVSALQTNSIRIALQAALNTLVTAGNPLASAIELVGNNNWLQIKLTDGWAADHRIEVEVFSSTARTAIFGYNGVASDYANLPPTAPDGYTLRFTLGFDRSQDYYLRYDAAEGAWLESAQLGLQTLIDRETMPVLVRNVLTDFEDLEIDHMPISSRLVGDELSSPDPSFVGATINDMFIFSNRLGFTSKNNVIMSRIDEFDMFYRTSIAQTLPADRVDLKASVPTTRYSDLNFAVPFDKELILFGESAQYSLSANTGFDVRTASLSTLTEYESDPDVSPINIGSSIYFPVVRGAYTAIFDLARRGDMGLSAEEITQHIPVFIKGSIRELVHSATENMVFARTDLEPRTLYVQNRFVRDTQLQQNAWQEWLMPNDITGISLIGSKLFVTMISEDKEYLIRGFIDISLSLITQTTTTAIDFNPYLDKITLLSQNSLVELGEEDNWETADYVVLPEDEEKIVGINSRGFRVIGIDAINEALEEEPLWVGVPYKFTYVFSQQVPAMYDEQGKTAMQYARMVIQSMKISYTNSGKFKVLVKPTGRDESVAPFSGALLGLNTTVLGRINLSSGVFKFPVHCRAESVRITIESEEPYPVTFNTCELQAKLNINSGRM